MNGQGEADPVLAGIQVVDLTTSVAGSLATMLLADYGAQVVRIEYERLEAADAGAAMRRRGKLLAPMEPGTEAGRDELLRLVRAADVLAVDDDEQLRGLDLRSSTLRDESPHLIVLKAPTVDGGAPWAGGHESNGLISAMYGLSARQVSFSGTPVEPVHDHILTMHGIWAAACTMAAIVERTSSGTGQEVSVDGVQGALLACIGTLSIDVDLPDPDTAVGPYGRHPLYSVFEAGDGRWLAAGALGGKFEARLLHELGKGHLLDDPRLADSTGGGLSTETLTWLRGEVSEAYKLHPRDEWLDRLDRAGIPCGPVQRRPDWFDGELVEALDLRDELEDPRVGRTAMPARPVELSNAPKTAEPARVLGSSTELPSRRTAPVERTAGARAPLRPGPLHGLRFLNMGTFVAGPMSGSLLAELGADVIKIEQPTGDPFRSAGFMYSRGMRSLAIDLASDDGRAAFGELVSSSDGLMSSLRPGVPEKLGIDEEQLRSFRPDLAIVRLSGYGNRGPWADKPGVDMVLQAMSGMMLAQGGKTPMVNTLAITDFTSAALSVLGMLLGVYDARTRGRGQRADVCLASTATFCQYPDLVEYEGRPQRREGGTDYKGGGELERLYPVADGWIRVARRPDRSPTVDGDVGELIVDRSGKEAIAMLEARGLAAARARAATEVIRDDRLLSAGVLQLVAADNGTVFSAPGRCATFSRTQRNGPLRTPGAGEHSVAVLRDSGLAQDHIDALLESGSLAQGQPMLQQLGPVYR
ncbi:CoA transferase [Cumulibacter soli]|uniref:CoA transferase n=1 Tax=Cumulibacter soli TaxID=2546344 RepID=UPI001067CA94|nr:CoA transferase [Cumulibacter soli]